MEWCTIKPKSHMLINHIMKTFFISIVAVCALLLSVNCMAQLPQAVNYQAVARDADGNLLDNQNISVRLSIHNTDAGGTVVFSEEHNITTNQFGLFNLMIGTGSAVVGDFTTINWFDDLKFLHVEMDVNGGNNFVDMGAQQLISVPYALAAEQADALSSGATVAPYQITDGGAMNGQVLMWDGANWIPATTAEGTIYSGGNGINVSGSTITNSGDLSNTNELQTITLSGANITLSNSGATVTLPDASATNEIQTLTLSGANLALSNGGGSVTLPTGTTYTAGSGINIAGNAISATDASNTNEIQTITLSGANLSLSNGGGSVTLPTGTTYSAGSGISIAGNAISASDASATNELQTLSVNGNTMSITGGNTVNLPAGAAYTQGDGIILNGTEISAVDESATNELQTISILGNTISVSNGGNAVAIPNSWISVGGEHIVNPNAGNVAIDPLAFSIPTASLDVYRGTGLDGTAAFRGSVHSSHFNYATNEDTFIRAGKTSSNVYINDSHNGNVNIATGGGGVGIGVNSNLSYKAQLASNFGKGMRIDVSGTSATTPEGLTISMTSASSLNKYGLYGESSGLGTGGNFGVVGNAMGGASGYKIGVLGTANGTGLSAPSIGVQGVASSSSGSANFGLHGLAVTATTAANFGVYALASASSQGTSFVPNESLNGTAYPNNFHEIFSVYGDYDYLTPGNQGWAGFFNGDVYAYNVFYQSSDSTLKTNVQTIAHGLEAVKSLRPVSYQMKESAGRDSKFSDETSYGFIAQEVYDVLPELVTALVHPVDVKMHGDERALLALNYDGFIPVLTSAVQEQHGQMEALQQENKKLIEQLNAQASTNDWQTQELEELKREVEAFRVLVLQLSSTKK